MTKRKFNIKGTPAVAVTRHHEPATPTSSPLATALKPIVELLHKALATKKWPRLHIQTDIQHPNWAPKGLQLRLSVAGSRSAHPLSITVTDNKARFEERSYFGWIDKETGKFNPGRDLNKQLGDTIRQELSILAENPARYASIHGQDYNFCMFCGLELTHPDSVAVGYGPICAENHGLPWDGMAEVINEQREADEFANGLDEVMTDVVPMNLQAKDAQFIDELRKLCETHYFEFREMSDTATIVMNTQTWHINKIKD